MSEPEFAKICSPDFMAYAYAMRQHDYPIMPFFISFTRIENEQSQQINLRCSDRCQPLVRDRPGANRSTGEKVKQPAKSHDNLQRRGQNKNRQKDARKRFMKECLNNHSKSRQLVFNQFAAADGQLQPGCKSPIPDWRGA